MAIIRRHEDPYAPKAPRKARPGPTVPRARMHRLGASARTVAACVEAFGRMGDQERAAWADGWAVKSDGELDVDLADIDGLFDASPAQMTGWLAGQDDKARAVTIAIVVEEARPAPRANVLSRLSKALR